VQGRSTGFDPWGEDLETGLLGVEVERPFSVAETGASSGNFGGVESDASARVWNTHFGVARSTVFGYALKTRAHATALTTVGSTSARAGAALVRRAFAREGGALSCAPRLGRREAPAVRSRCGAGAVRSASCLREWIRAQAQRTRFVRWRTERAKRARVQFSRLLDLYPRRCGAVRRGYVEQRPRARRGLSRTWLPSCCLKARRGLSTQLRFERCRRAGRGRSRLWLRFQRRHRAHRELPTTQLRFERPRRACRGISKLRPRSRVSSGYGPVER